MTKSNTFFYEQSWGQIQNVPFKALNMSSNSQLQSLNIPFNGLKNTENEGSKTVKQSPFINADIKQSSSLHNSFIFNMPENSHNQPFSHLKGSNSVSLKEEVFVCCLMKECGSPIIGYYFDCLHSYCKDCMLKLINQDIFNVKCQRCSDEMKEDTIKVLLGSAESYTSIYNTQLKSKFMPNCIECPNKNCLERVTFEKGTANYNEKDIDGAVMSREACESYAYNRCRCPSCKNDFCVSCAAFPFHLGKTCDQYQEFKNAKRCRYDDQVISIENKGPTLNCCNNFDCIEKFNQSCKKKLACGHDCFGHELELKCGPCLNKDCKDFGSKYSQDEESFCSICYVETLKCAPIIKLDCDHIYHHSCFKNKLKKKWIGPQIEFAFSQCLSCNCIVNASNNPDIQSEITAVIELKDGILKKVAERFKLEGLDKHEKILDPNSEYSKDPLKYGLKVMVFYLCVKCHKPYFAGLKQCGDQENNRDYNPMELICGACGALDNVAGSPICKTHGKDFIEYKCKFCCDIASWFCWGTTHFCESCHTRQANNDYVTKIPKSKLPVCPGEKECKLKIKHPPNGEEFALGCSVCKNNYANMNSN